METAFEPVRALAGGALIGLSALLLMASLGRIAGVSGIVAPLLPPGSTARGEPWRWAFIAGLVVAPLLHILVQGAPLESVQVSNPVLLVLGGLLTGFGVVVGSGCTSGHGVCGIARLSLRSLAATVTFLGVAMVTTTAVRHLFAIPAFGILGG